MRVLAAMLALGACSSSSTPTPDAAPLVRDIVACDPTWIGQPQHCEAACETPPAGSPCNGKTPCYDHAACSVQQRAGGVDPATCQATFVATDSQGMHTGCCYVSGSQAYFAECKT